MSAPALQFGSELVQRMLRIRAPYIMVDRVESFVLTPRVTVTASRYVSANEPVFAGHFDFLAVLPGTMLLEGMSQTAGLLMWLTVMQRNHVASGRAEQEFVSMLRNVDLGFRMEPGYRPGVGDEIVAALAKVPTVAGVLAANSIKYRKPVFPGACVMYTAALVREMEALWHFDVAATAGGRTVAEGTLTNAILPIALPTAAG